MMPPPLWCILNPMTAVQRSRSPLLSLHRLSWRALSLADDLLHGLWAGFWLGFFRREDLHRLDEAFYGVSKKYGNRGYNSSGLYGWEAEAIDCFFERGRRLLLLGAGAGRELVGLIERGFEVEAYECHEGLRTAGNELLSGQDGKALIEPMPRDRCPGSLGSYDGIILGWGMLTLVQGRSTRVELLRCLRSVVPVGTPMLLSFYVMPSSRRPYRVARKTAGVLRVLFRREKPDFGDYLSPGYGHFFSREGLEEELTSAGWKLEFFDQRVYPHAVGVAAEPGGSR